LRFSYSEFLWTPLPSPTFSLLTGQWLDFHQLADYHASRTAGNLRHTGVGIVLETGDRTEIDRINRMISEATELETPLTRKSATSVDCL
jgi:magnesium-transporting ATPase (P-type)